MKILNYEALSKPKKTSWLFWLVFAVAYLPGVVIVGVADASIHKWLMGNRSDGSIMVLALFAAPFIVAAVGVIKTIWARFDTIALAAIFALFLPVVIYLIWLAVSLFSH